MKIELDDVVCLRDTAITIKGARRRVTVPIEIVKLMGLRDKDKVRWLALKDGTVLLKKTNSITPTKTS
jgi:bifunctional DNA-binding transcriptional regulator/antitoxin component of YhaV-PrlF toxin-antitoxin module